MDCVIPRNLFFLFFRFYCFVKNNLNDHDFTKLEIRKFSKCLAFNQNLMAYHFLIFNHPLISLFSLVSHQNFLSLTDLKMFNLASFCQFYHIKIIS